MIHALLSLAAFIAAPTPLQGTDPFPKVEPESVGLPSESLEALARFVEGQVEADEYVGAELLVIKDGKTVLHGAWGWKDREREIPLEIDTLFNVRSMTKPLVGTAAQMLIEEGRLELDGKAAAVLPGFDNDASREITVQHLLEHRAGLKLSSLIGTSMHDFENLRGLAEAIGTAGPDNAPGERFGYSDDGTSVLGACVEAASESTLASFLHERILTPLGMRDSTFDVTQADLQERIATSYMGVPGSWMQQWSPLNEPMYPFLLGSQGLYCTARDYARFLSAWMNRGRFEDARLLNSKATRRALKPASRANGIPTGLGDLEVHYGQMWVLYVDPTLPRTKQVVAFGHSGSDGTYALAWPQLDLMAFCFTQSRGSLGLLDFERELHRLVLAPGELPPFEPSAAQLEELTGFYWSSESDMYRHLQVVDGRLIAELPGRIRLKLRHSDPDHLTFELSPRTKFTVSRNDAGAVTGFEIREGDDSDSWSRFELGADMPPLDEILAKARVRERSERLNGLGGLRFSGTLTREQPELEGTFVSYGLPDGRHRREIDARSETVLSVWDGDHGWLRISERKLNELTGKSSGQARLEHPAFSESDWTRLFDELQPVRTGENRGRAVWLLRALSPDAYPVTIGIDAETGRLVGTMKIAVVPGSGEMGVTTEYDDWREVDGLEFPFVLRTRAASSAIGELVLTVESIETGLDLDEELFRAPNDG